ncbi:stage II sporulation protein M [Ruminococcus sp.]|uniref:stage II sporulation protein M n=1 Tax=Ruminococcus sp. TaxID=41978 RepID=UPI003F014EB0
MYQNIGACCTATHQRRRQLQLFLYVLLAGFLTGIVLTAVFPDRAASSLWLDQGLSEQVVRCTLPGLFFRSFLPTFGLLLCCMLLGLSAFGQAGAILVLLYRGIGLGIAVSRSYLNWGLQGLPVVLFLQLPHSGVTSFLLLLAVRETWRLSSRFAAFVCHHSGEEGEPLRYYWIRFFVLTLLLLLAAAGDSALTYCLSGRLMGYSGGMA